MFGKLAALFLLAGGIALASIKPTDFSPRPLPPWAISSSTRHQTAAHYTGLIVLTTGFRVSRSTSPHIYDEGGRLIFGLVPQANGAVKGQNVSLALKIGVAGYAFSLGKAMKDKRVGPHPMVVHIVNINTNPGNWYPKDVDVSREDGNRILAANRTTHFLQDFKVVFVVNPANL